jgi:shikimate kinase
MDTTIVLIGPMCAGKSSTAKILAERLGLPYIELDELRWAYYRELDAYEELVALLKSGEIGLLEQYNYWKPFEAHAVERVVPEYPNCVLDFGAGHGVYEDEALLARVQHALSTVAHVILLLPAPDVAEATAVLNARFAQLLQEVAGTVNPEALQLNEHFVQHPSSRRLATQIVYTGDLMPEAVAEMVLQQIGA